MPFSVAVKRISSAEDMNKWLQSQAYSDYLQFLHLVNRAVTGKSNFTKTPESDIINRLLLMLKTIDDWISDVPPVQQPARFGNQAFRTFHSRLCERADELVQSLLPENVSDAVGELIPYLMDSFGNATRIDYGTGHEANFAMFLFCLQKLEVVKSEDLTALAIHVFNKYLTVCRRLQLTYRMEPAGSHGVWSLDDFQFLAFLWGSAQLINHPKYDPSCFLDPQTIERCKEEFLWMGCIDFIGQVKSGPFAEHSNQLYSISAVPSWSKVNQGLFRMYEAEVLKKFPVVQHFLFGSLLSFDQKTEV